MLAKGS